MDYIKNLNEDINFESVHHESPRSKKLIAFVTFEMNRKRPVNLSPAPDETSIESLKDYINHVLFEQIHEDAQRIKLLLDLVVAYQNELKNK